MILALKTDAPTAEIYLYDDGKQVATDIWQADRSLARDLLGHLERIVTPHGGWSALTGLVVYKGPGSFTGLRIGITVFNTLADGLEIPIVGETGESWITDSLESLTDQKNDTIVLPFYGADPHITKPKK